MVKIEQILDYTYGEFQLSNFNSPQASPYKVL